MNLSYIRGVSGFALYVFHHWCLVGSPKNGVINILLPLSGVKDLRDDASMDIN